MIYYFILDVYKNKLTTQKKHNSYYIYICYMYTIIVILYNKILQPYSLLCIIHNCLLSYYT